MLGLGAPVIVSVGRHLFGKIKSVKTIKLITVIALSLLDPFTVSASSLLVDQEPNKVAQKLNEYAYGFDDDKVRTKDDLNAHLANFAYLLKQDENLNGYMIFYNARKWNGRNHWFSLEAQLRGLTTSLGVSEKRVKVVKGGYRNNPTMELWLVPKGVTVLKASPSCTSKRSKRG